MEELIQQAVKEYVENFVGICELNKKYKIPNKIIREAIEKKGYFLGKGVSPKSVINIKNAVDEYIEILETEGAKEPNVFSLSKKYEISHTAITDTLNRLNIKIIKYPKIIQFNECIFDSIDTEEKAYWLGFFAADGYICNRYNSIGISLAIVDIEHLQKFANFLGCPKNVKTRNLESPNILGKFPSCRVDIANKHLKATLLSYGFTSNKTNDLVFPDISIFKSKELIFDFIRGFCDGDGSLGIYQWSKRYNTIKYGERTTISTVARISFVGTKLFLLRVQSFLGGTQKLQKGHSSTENFFSLTYQANKVKRVADLLYKNSTIYLDRKYKKYKEFAVQDKKFPELLVSNIGESCDANTEISLDITNGSKPS